MRILCRADASVEIGHGHVVRCATLARALADAGHTIQFVCRERPGDLNDWIAAQGFEVIRLVDQRDGAPSEQDDARACREAVGGRRYDWIVVDHYGLGAAWERDMADLSAAVCAIDDVGREHACGVLLDPNYPNATQRLYPGRVPAGCALMLGTEYALVRPEFAALRSASTERIRRDIARVLVVMGGSDPFNETAKALRGIARAGRPDLRADVVIGAAHPDRSAVEAACADLAGATLHVQTSRMADLMAAADLAICGAGNVTWERCVLGLPALVTILAENQAASAEAVAAAGAHRLLGRSDALTADAYARALGDFDTADLSRMSAAAAAICDGRGAERVADRLLACGSGQSPAAPRVASAAG